MWLYLFKNKLKSKLNIFIIIKMKLVYNLLSVFSRLFNITMLISFLKYIQRIDVFLRK